MDAHTITTSTNAHTPRFAGAEPVGSERPDFSAWVLGTPFGGRLLAVFFRFLLFLRFAITRILPKKSLLRNRPPGLYISAVLMMRLKQGLFMTAKPEQQEPVRFYCAQAQLAAS
ncbi:hypothetical protein ES703_45010 [subsurface metagenome]